MNEHSGIQLQDKVVVITGASRGIGEAVAHTFAAAGAKIVVASRKQESVDAVAAAIRAAGGDALAVAAHTGDEEAVQGLIDTAVATFGQVDVLINNAATNPHFGPIMTAETSHWDKTFDVNIKGYFRTARAVLPVMQRQGGGKIINVASVAGIRQQPGMGVYCVSKAGVLMLTQVLAAELAGLNIQVNAIAPGFVKTKFSSAIWDNPELHRAVMQLIPQHRMALPEELTGIMLYLASSASSFTTGAVFTVDGGQLIGPTLT